MVLIAIDAKNAFNTASWKGINTALGIKGVPAYLRNVVGNYLSDRVICAAGGITKSLSAGVPQGSVLGPTLWNILYDGIFACLDEEWLHAVAYADDLAIMISADEAECMTLRIKEALRRVDRWFNLVGLELATEKTECLVLKGRVRDINNIIHQGATIAPTTSLKYLGVMFEHKGSFGAHVKYAIDKATRRAASLAIIMRNTYVTSTEKRRLLCSVVDNTLLYAAPIWGEVVAKVKFKKLLIQAQRRNLSRMACSFRTVSGKALQVITGAPPIYYDIQRRRDIFRQQSVDAPVDRQTLSLQIVMRWQEEWDAEMVVAQWTKRLIPNVRIWQECTHKNLG